MRRGRLLLLAVAALFLGLSLFNASWLASAPPGRLMLVAHRGTAQPIDRAAAAATGSDCTARHIGPLSHTYIENSLFAMQGAVAYGAEGFALDVQPSADGHAMIFRDATLECRTDGTGPVRQRPLSYLKRLDIGHGYSADNGRNFPLRGRGVGAMPTAAELLRLFPTRFFLFKLGEPAAAEAIVRAFAEAGITIGDRHAFAGPPAAVARLRALAPAAIVLDPQASDACLAAYRRIGWIGRVPENCRGAFLLLPRRGGWTLWGWPYRFLSRLHAAGARFIIGGGSDDGTLVGLEAPEQLGEVPRDYRGLLLIEDMHNVGRALIR